METACADITYVSWPDAFIVRKRGRFPSSRMHSDRIEERTPRNKPQGMPVIKLGHFPMTGGPQVRMRLGLVVYFLA
jgi:hypothetical protein